MDNVDKEGSGNNISGCVCENLTRKVVESDRSGREICNSRRERELIIAER